MKKEILRVNNLSYSYSARKRLNHISLCLLEGDCVGMLGLTYSGVSALISFLTHNIDENEEAYQIYVEGKRMTDWNILREKVYKITASNYVISDWTVAEYVALVEEKSMPLLFRKNIMAAEVESVFEEMGIPFDASRRLSDISEMEKRIVDLIKAYKIGAKIVIIEDEFEGVSLKEVKLFAQAMKKIITGRMTVMVSSHSNEIVSILSNKYFVFDKGHIIKKTTKDYVFDNTYINLFLRGEMSSTRQEISAPLRREHRTEKSDMIYQISRIPFLSEKQSTLQFSKGEVTTLLVQDREKQERLFLTLSGRGGEQSISYQVGGEMISNVNIASFVQKRIVSIHHLGSKTEVFEKMTIGENLLIPSMEKLSSYDYIVSAYALFNKLEEIDGITDVHRKARKLRINELIQVTLERWYIFNPRVLVMIEPFSMCDAEGVRITKNFIDKFASRGTSVIIVKTRAEYIQDISDRIIHIR